MMRAVTIPVQGPDATGNPTEMGEAWKTLREKLRGAWDASTMLANWAVQQLQRLDITRSAGDKKMPAMPKEIYLYGLFGQYANRSAWEGAAASAQSLLRMVEACWREERWETIWLYDRSARTYRWPTPFPIHNANWRLEKSDQGIWTCSLAFPSGRIGIRLRNDRTMHYQRKRLEQLLSGDAVAGEAAIYARPIQGNDRCNGLQIRGPGGRQDYRVLLKLAAWFPRPQFGDVKREGTILIHTGNDALLYAEQEGEEPWIYNGDELRRRIIGHRAMLKRHSDDTKEERRFPAEMRKRHNEGMQLRCVKHNNYVASALAEIAAMIAGLARRRRVATIEYDDSERGFIPTMNYSDLKRRIVLKANEFGIEFKIASGEVVNETPELAREEQ